MVTMSPATASSSLDLLEPLVAEQLGDPAAFDAAVAIDQGDGFAGVDLAVEDLAGGERPR